MKTIFAWPYHAESKPIERFFGTFGECERRIPSYVGTTIEKKPPHLKRGEKIHKVLHEKFFQGYTPSIYEAHTLIAEYVDEYANRSQQSGHLKGQRPIDVFMEGKGPGLTLEQIAELRLLMMTMKVSTIKRDGIELPGRRGHFYYHPALFGRRHPVLVRHDWHPDSSIYVFQTDGTFLCEASLMPHVHPAANRLGTEEDRAEVTRQIQMKRGQEKQTFRVARQLLQDEILPETLRRLQGSGLSKKETQGNEASANNLVDIDSPPSAEEIAQATREFDEFMAAPPIQWERKAEPPVRAPKEFKVDWDSLASMSDLDRFELLLECEARELRIKTSEKRWMSLYEKGEEYRRFKNYFEDTVLKFRLIHGAGSAESPGNGSYGVLEGEGTVD
jgi:putative transposase